MRIVGLLAQSIFDPPQHSPWPTRLTILGLIVVGAIVKAVISGSGRKDTSLTADLKIASRAGSTTTSEVRVSPARVPVGLLLGGYISALLATQYLPPILGLVGLVCGVIAIRRNSRHGVALIIVSFVCAVVGMFLGAAAVS
jgi:hypothetical protein